MKMILSDLDGTLEHKGTISPESLEAIKKLQETGYIFTIATGRHFKAGLKVAKSLDIKYPVIFSNGAYIYDVYNDVVIQKTYIEDSVLKKAFKICDKHNLNYLLYTDEEIVATVQSRKMLIDRIGSFEVKLLSKEEMKVLNGNILKLLIIENDVELLNNAKAELKTLSGVSVVQSQNEFLDIGSNKTNKGKALKFLADYLNVPIDECMAIGDQENDLTMIQTAGLGVAIGDGAEKLKEAADFVTKPFNENGFSFAINCKIFNK